MSATVDIRPGTTLGPYTLVRRVGEGASATVFAARDRSGREVAVKVRRTGTSRARGVEAEMDRRFLREFESMRLLRVKGVVQVHEAGIEDDVLWYAMDLVDGRPFHEVFTGPMASRVERCRRLGAELLRILASLHDAGFVHRDIKPTNVLVDAQDRVAVLDFGIGRYFGDHDTLSHTGEVLGTVPYMAPEQVSGLPCDARIDVFAAGLVLWEAMAGKRERPATAVGWIPRICLERLPPLCTLSTEVPRSFSRAIERLLAVDPTDRSSAREGERELLASGADAGLDWPDGPFVEPPGWSVAEGVLGGGSEHPPVCVVEGPSGSGRRRVAEQVHRVGLLQGVWTLHVACRAHRVGNPLRQLLEQLARLLDDATLARIVGQGAAVLRRTWPQLVLPKTEGAARGLTEALVEVVASLARVRPAALVVRDLEQVDPVTARVLLALADRRPRDLGLLLLHEPRWATPESTELVAGVCARGASLVSLGPVAPGLAAEAARAVAPRSTVSLEGPCTFSQAMVVGWTALARSRREPFTAPDDALLPLVAAPGPVPAPVWDRLTAGRPPGPLPGLVLGDEGATADGDTVSGLLRARLHDRRAAAAQLGRASEEVLGHRAEFAAELAATWMLAQDPGRAWAPAARAAVFEEQYERYVAARDWLLLLDTLPPARRDPRDDFELALVQARVALHTDDDDDGERGFVLVERLARTEDEEARVRLLRAEFDLRQGQVKSALVTSLRIGSSPGIRPHVQVQALLVAFRCRVGTRQIPEAVRDLERAEGLLTEHPHPVLQVRVSNARAELALLQEDLLWCRALCQKNIRVASQTRHLHALAEASFRLGLVLRMLGRRREAEHHIRSAADAALATGDLRIRADAALALAALLCERGEALPARLLLDDTIRRIRALSLTHLLPVALRVALQIATLTGNATDGNVALASLTESPTQDPEAAAALVQWWRTNGDIDRALSIPAPAASPRSYGHGRWLVEQARTRLVAGDPAGAAPLAATAAERAAELGFAELEVYAGLLTGVTGAVDEATWASLQERAVGSMWCDVFLGAIEMDARRLSAVSPAAAESRWRSLLVRARELGHRPGVEEASGWLGGS